jgi:hypothetical protein
MGEADGSWNELRTGKIVEHFVLFPYPFAPGDILLFSDAVAWVTGDAPVKYDKTRTVVNISSGIGGEVVSPKWVQSVAGVGSRRAFELRDALCKAYEREYAELPECNDGEDVEAVSRLILLCQTAANDSMDVVHVWAIV